MIKDFDAGVPLIELSLKYSRNMGAIQTRLLTLGRKDFLNLSIPDVRVCQERVVTWFEIS